MMKIIKIYFIYAFYLDNKIPCQIVIKSIIQKDNHGIHCLIFLYFYIKEKNISFFISRTELNKNILSKNKI